MLNARFLRFLPARKEDLSGGIMMGLRPRSMVGIELGRVCFRRRATTLTLSVARWVRNSAMATFPEAPL